VNTGNTGEGDACRPPPPDFGVFDSCSGCVHPLDHWEPSISLCGLIPESDWICGVHPEAQYNITGEQSEWIQLASLYLATLANNLTGTSNLCGTALDTYSGSQNVLLCISQIPDILEYDCNGTEIPLSSQDVANTCVDILNQFLNGTLTIVDCQSLSVTPSPSQEPTCGNGVLDEGEECDPAMPTAEWDVGYICTEECVLVFEITNSSSDSSNSSSSNTTTTDTTDDTTTIVDASVGLAFALILGLLCILSVVFLIKSMLESEKPIYRQGF